MNLCRGLCENRNRALVYSSCPGSGEFFFLPLNFMDKDSRKGYKGYKYTYLKI